jgi:hypothetical protein
VIIMNTDDLEQQLMRRCHRWMGGKPTTVGELSPVQATARVFLAQALTAWRAAEMQGETDKLAPDFDSWVKQIIADQLPYVREHLDVQIRFPRH